PKGGARRVKLTEALLLQIEGWISVDPYLTLKMMSQPLTTKMLRAAFAGSLQGHLDQGKLPYYWDEGPCSPALNAIEGAWALIKSHIRQEMAEGVHELVAGPPVSIGEESVLGDGHRARQAQYHRKCDAEVP
ncbi:hypothetical protein FOZ63_000045, partial [Perkinsus olseni]